MDLTAFLTYDEVRAVLGVSQDDIEDSTLALDVYKYGLLDAFEEMEVSPLEAYLSIYEGDPAQMEAVEFRLYRAVRLFAVYQVARELLGALPMFAPKEHTDGKASAVRFSADPYKDTKKSVEQRYEQQLQRLANAIAAYNSTAKVERAIRPYFIGVASGSDPVTGS